MKNSIPGRVKMIKEQMLLYRIYRDIECNQQLIKSIETQDPDEGRNNASIKPYREQIENSQNEISSINLQLKEYEDSLRNIVREDCLNLIDQRIKGEYGWIEAETAKKSEQAHLKRIEHYKGKIDYIRRLRCSNHSRDFRNDWGQGPSEYMADLKFFIDDAFSKR